MVVFLLIFVGLSSHELGDIATIAVGVGGGGRSGGDMRGTNHFAIGSLVESLVHKGSTAVLASVVSLNKWE